ncbi:qde-2-interacting protein [Ophiostoma piceae UAMH 11346]|uniref:Qde-2-interacting protein n=1 Tax=Ophiostoma piceae (strain UAMH 11346) TaxID=1262450 RepID=S3C891_OPHP1|nr:qde-2-interacting protein [Ophiostoma piceae UAMH 11346]
MDISPLPETPPPAHWGLLRDEVLALRKLFGYWHQDTAQTLSPSSDLPAYLGHALPGSTMSDVLLVAFDVDTKHSYETLANDQEFHIGISILDTRSVHDYILAPAPYKVETAIQSYQFNVGDSKYIRRVARNFLFGDAEAIQLVDLESKFENLTVGRQMILVFHGGSASDWKIFQGLQLDQQPLFVLETVKAAQHPLRLSYRWSLEKLLDTFHIPFAALHAAGNGAHFFLRALAMIAVKDAESRPDGAADDAWVQAMTDIARLQLPARPEPGPTADEIRHQDNQEAKERRKAKRAAKIERRRREREDRSFASISADPDLDEALPPAITEHCSA